MKAFVTGGAGYVGSHLTEELLRRGYTVTVLDNFSRGSRENLSAVANHPNLTVVQGDIQDQTLVNQLAKDASTIYHLAAAVGVKHYVENPLHVIETNVNGTKCILEAAFRYKAKVVFTSTSEVYGKSTQVPFREDGDRTLGPTNIDRWCYSTSKALDEHLCFAYYRKGLPMTIVRYFNSYGPRADVSEYGGVAIRFVLQALKGDPITVHNDGSQSRSFTYVSDTVNGTIAAGESSIANGQVYNIGNNREVTIQELAVLVKDLSSSLSPIHYVPYKDFYGAHYEDIPRRVPSIEKANRDLGWSPTVLLKDGLRACIAHYSNQLSGR